MFTKIKSIITNHAKQIDSMKAVFLEQKKACYDNTQFMPFYKDGLFAEIKEKYDSDRLSLIQENKKAVEDCFSEIFEILENAITAEIGQEAIAELQMLTNAAVSEFEINAYAKKYVGKYKALRLLAGIAKKNGIPFTYVTDAIIVNDLNYLKSSVIRFFNEYDGQGLMTQDYYARLILFFGENESADGNLFSKIEVEFNDFIQPTVANRTYDGDDSDNG